MEDCHGGGQLGWRTVMVEDSEDGRLSWWRTVRMEDCHGGGQ